MAWGNLSGARFCRSFRLTYLGGCFDSLATFSCSVWDCGIGVFGIWGPPRRLVRSPTQHWIGLGLCFHPPGGAEVSRIVARPPYLEVERRNLVYTRGCVLISCDVPRLFYPRNHSFRLFNQPRRRMEQAVRQSVLACCPILFFALRLKTWHHATFANYTTESTIIGKGRLSHVLASSLAFAEAAVYSIRR